MYKNTPTKNVSKSYGGSTSSSFTMKNSMLRKGSMHRTPMQMNYGSPAKDYSVTKGSHAHKMGSPMEHAKFGSPHGPEKNHSGTPEAHSSDGANPIQPEPKKTKKKKKSLKQTTPGHFTKPERVEA